VSHLSIETRSSREAVVETLLFTGLLLVFTTFPFVLIGLAQGAPVGLRAASDAGGVLLDHVGWALSGHIAVLLGFYVVVIGGQILGGGDAAARVRRILGGVAELIAAAAIVLVVIVGVYCAAEPRTWAVFIAIGPVVLLVLFLGVQVGNFLIPSREFRIEEAKRSRIATRSTLRALTVRSRRSPIVVWAATSVAIAIPSATVAMITGPGLSGSVFTDLANLSIVAGFFGATSAVFLGWNAFALYTASVDRARSTSVIFALITVWMYWAVLALALPMIQKGEGWFGWSLLTTALLTVGFSLVPPGQVNDTRADWSFRGAVRRVVAQRAARSYAKAVRELIEFSGVKSQPSPTPSTFRRLVEALRTRPSTDG
jgi:hypothetical protein